MLVLCALQGCAQENTAAHPSPSFDRSAWLQDYADLKHELERRYANLAWLASPSSKVDLPALDRRAVTGFDDAKNDDDAKAVMSAFIAGFRDGHLSWATVAPHANDPVEDIPPPDLAALDARRGCAALGYAPVTRIAFTLPFDALPSFSLQADGVERVFRAGTVATPQGKKIGVVRVPRFRPQDVPPSLCIAAWQALQSAQNPITKTALAEAAQDLWLATMADQLHAFKQDGVAAVIVDVGGNGGGNDSGDWLPRLFTTQPVHSAPLWMADSSESAAYYDEQLNELQSAMKALRETDAMSAAVEQQYQTLQEAHDTFAEQKSRLAAQPCDLSWVWREQRDWQSNQCRRLAPAGYASGRFDYLAASTFAIDKLAKTLYWPTVADRYRGAWSGPVFVLIDHMTASSAEMFAAAMQDNGIAKIVGEHSLGAGCGFMSSSPKVILKHSGLQLQVPNCVRLRADGSDEVAGITPDIDLAPRQGEDARARAFRLLRIIDGL